MANVLELKNVTKHFGSLVIFEDINISLSGGEIMAILGPSGAGKSTLLHIAGLMEAPTRGSVSISGQEMNLMSETMKAKERLNTVGFLFQFHHLLADFNLLENVLLPARLAQDDLENRTRRAHEILDRLGLKDRLHHYPHQLSGGEQQRAAFARAMIRAPRILLCDEPTGNLDHRSAHEMMSLMKEEINREHLSTIIVTHNETLAKQAHSSYHLSDGRLVKQ